MNFWFLSNDATKTYSKCNCVIGLVKRAPERWVFQIFENGKKCDCVTACMSKEAFGDCLGFSNRVLRTRFHPQRQGHFAPLSFIAYGDKIQATRFTGGR